MPTDIGRARHYRDFYSPAVAAPVGSPSGELPNILVYGNCQAEAVRVLLEASGGSGVALVRIPPVFELVADDIRFLRQVAGRSHILLSQPVADGYHGLPLGTNQVAAMMPPGAVVIRWPVVRFAGLHPFQVIVRDPRDGAHDPPVVPYHDLRTLAAARTGQDRPTPEPCPDALLAVGHRSVDELRRRELRDCDVMISDLFASPEPDDMATINHPGNRVLTELARRIQRAIGASKAVVDPGRTLLGDVVAPLESSVIAALRLSAPVRPCWTIGQRTVTPATVRQAHMRWYEKNPAVVDAGWMRHRETMRLLGLS